tara:strand:- start:31494 stop:32441 length:948 start_codon:yes stop_codon:yes gene_type:complete
MSQNAITLFLMSALAACSAEGVGTGEPIGADAGDDVIVELSLEVDPTDASTYWSSIPMSGRGPAGGTLLYTTPGGGQFSENLGASGDFCVNVILKKDFVNTIKFEAVSTDGEYTDPVLMDVRQSGEPPDTEPNPDPEPGYSNIASGATIDTHTVFIEEGSFSSLVDGDSSGHIEVFNDANEPDWMVIELNDRLPIEQFHIETTTECPMESYKILLNDSAQSEDPIIWSWPAGGAYVYGAGWTIVAVVEDGSSDEIIMPSIGDPRARRMAIEFLSGDCGSFFGRGRHDITEIEVWARGEDEPGGGQTSNGAPSCEN